MILILEARQQDFVKVFWEYVIEAGYKFGWKNSDTVHFYRFTEPKPGYPFMIELFSREPDYIKSTPTGIIPIHVDDDITGYAISEKSKTEMDPGKRREMIPMVL